MNSFRLPTLLVLTAIALVSILAACESTPTPKTLSSGLYPQYMDTTIRPGDDFFAYVNGGWMDTATIPADKSAYGVAYAVNDELQEQVKGIIADAAKGDAPAGSDAQKIGDLYAAYMDTAARNAKGAEPLQAGLAEIQALTDHDAVMAYMAEKASMGYRRPFAMYVSPDAKNPSAYAVYFTQSGISLPNRDYYLTDNGNFPALREGVQKHMANMFGLAGVANGSELAEKVFAFETTIATHHWTKEEMRQRSKQYHPHSIDSLKSTYPNIAWESIIDKAGLSGKADRIIVRQPSYLHAMNDFVRTTDLDTWKAYLSWNKIRSDGGSLSNDFFEESFDFYGRQLSGAPEPQKAWRRGVETVNGVLGELVGKLYVEEYFPPAAKARMDELVVNLLSAYKVSIEELDWMSAETKVQALDKLSKFTPKIGYPDKWKDYSAIDIDKDNLLASVHSARKANYDKQIAKLGGPIDKTEWGMNPQTLNAYYNPSMNEIVFPAAILQPPFFDMSADDAVNYGAIGAVIGHEIGHGFDDQGSTYDGDGAMRNWWTESDRAEFSTRTGGLVAQYDSYSVLPEVNVNGTFTLGENIGDLGGLSIALKAYEMSLNGKAASSMGGFTGVQRVFLGYGQVWRKIEREAFLRMQVSSDPHSPARFRVNGIVRNVPAFYEAFGVSAQDSLYLADEDRIKIW